MKTTSIFNKISHTLSFLLFFKKLNKKQKLYFEVGLGALLVVLVLSEPEALRAGGLLPLHNNFLLLPLLSIGHFVYLLKSLKDGNYYIGQTDNVQERLKKHNSGQVKSTKSRRPFVLVGYEEQAIRNEARWREYELKHHSDKKEAFIKKILAKKL